MAVTSGIGNGHSNPRTFTRQKISSCIFLLVIFTTLVVFYQIEAQKAHLPLVSCSSPPCSLRQRWQNLFSTSDFVRADDCARRVENATSRLRDMVTFLPLKDLRFAARPMEGHTWFMSSLNDTTDGNMSEHIHFPSEATRGRLLCIAGNDRSNGTRNSYGLAWADSLPHGATLLGGLTVMSDTYYDHENIWHGLSAVVPIVGWHKFKGCAMPARLVLFHWGELRTKMGNWVQNVVDATFGRRIEIEKLDHGGGAPTCFEEAVVFRNNEGGMPKLKRREVYDMIRCRARKYCNISTTLGATTGTKASDVRLTLFLRVGPRSFRNDSAVIEIFEKECDKVDGCRMTVMRPNNLTFCDQVKLLSETDVIVSQHGAQLTNMVFMDQNSSVMEFFPKGWQKLAGVGQYVHLWLANWSGMRHEGQWRDEEDGTDGGKACPYPAMDRRCFTYYKDRQIGHNESYFASWTSRVLARVKRHKLDQQTSVKEHIEQMERSACS